MAQFETFACQDCSANFAVESNAIEEVTDDLTCPLCAAPVPLEPESHEAD